MQRNSINGCSYMAYYNAQRGGSKNRGGWALKTIHRASLFGVCKADAAAKGVDDNEKRERVCVPGIDVEYSTLECLHGVAVSI